jgi:uncharacterized protein (TIGR03435 family)
LTTAAAFAQQTTVAVLIVDATGLQGGWNYLIGWTPRAQLEAPQTPNPGQTPGATAGAADPNGISVFDAVEKELGLKLVK